LRGTIAGPLKRGKTIENKADVAITQQWQVQAAGLLAWTNRRQPLHEFVAGHVFNGLRARLRVG